MECIGLQTGMLPLIHLDHQMGNIGYLHSLQLSHWLHIVPRLKICNVLSSTQLVNLHRRSYQRYEQVSGKKDVDCLTGQTIITSHGEDSFFLAIKAMETFFFENFISTYLSRVSTIDLFYSIHLIPLFSETDDIVVPRTIPVLQN